jgi:hypothetical protein
MEGFAKTWRPGRAQAICEAIGRPTICPDLPKVLNINHHANPRSNAFAGNPVHNRRSGIAIRGAM